MVGGAAIAQGQNSARRMYSNFIRAPGGVDFPPSYTEKDETQKDNPIRNHPPACTRTVHLQETLWEIPLTLHVSVFTATFTNPDGVTSTQAAHRYGKLSPRKKPTASTTLRRTGLSIATAPLSDRAAFVQHIYGAPSVARANPVSPVTNRPVVFYSGQPGLGR